MSTHLHDSQTSPFTPRYPVIGALVLSVTIAFLLGRGTALASRHAELPPSPQAVSAPAPQTPPWAEDGFRDGENASSTCVTPDCNG